jgi:hypothetical protein
MERSSFEATFLLRREPDVFEQKVYIRQKPKMSIRIIKSNWHALKTAADPTEDDGLGCCHV